jgi:hypothetical protein
MVVDDTGKPSPDVTLQLWEQASPGEARVFKAKSDANGVFRFRQVKPGTFRLRTAHARPISYFPGRASVIEAVPIVVRADAPLENLKFVLVDKARPRAIRVRVVDRDKRPVAGATILNFPINGRNEMLDGLSSFDGTPTTDGNGVAVLKGYEGARYRINAYKGSKVNTATAASLPLDIPPGSDDADVVLVLMSPFASRY